MDLRGKRYGRWTVISLSKNTPQKDRKWLCHCDCGTEREVLQRNLIYGASLSCGCLKVENSKKKTEHQLMGKVFSDLTVIQKAEKKGRGQGTWWLCECTCGNKVEVPGTLLVKGKKTSCGCKETISNHSLDIRGRRFGRLTALEATEKRSKKRNIIWKCECDCGNVIETDTNSLVYGNIQSCGCIKKENDEKLQSRITRVDGTCVEAIRSTKVPKNSSTKVKGVCYTKGKYLAKIVFQKKQYYLGKYDTLEEAKAVRKAAEEAVFERAVNQYERWKEKAIDEEWAKKNPFKIEVRKKSNNELEVTIRPEI